MSAAFPPPDSAAGASSHSLLAKQRTIVGPGFNRWLVPPAALAVHLCIGMAYGFSVFWLPLSRALGVTTANVCAKDASWLSILTTTSCDWPNRMLVGTFQIYIVLLGISAALWGGWLERVGPRKAGFAAALCWSGGLAVAALGVYLHQLWIFWLGAGVLGGIGLGLGYISPVSTLIKWFPDRRGMATGMAIMGFGGGALIGAPLADKLMKAFATPESVGVWQTLLVFAAIYLVFMMGGAFGYRVPAHQLAAGRLHAASDRHQHHGDAQSGASRPGLENTPVLAHLDGALHERVGRHRRARHGITNAAGSVRWQPDRKHHRL